MSGSPNDGIQNFWVASGSDSDVEPTRTVESALTSADFKKDDWQLAKLKKSKNNKKEKKSRRENENGNETVKPVKQKKLSETSKRNSGSYLVKVIRENINLNVTSVVPTWLPSYKNN